MFNTTLPNGWHWHTLEDIQRNEKRATITGPFGSSIGRKFFVERGIPVIRGNNLTIGCDRFIDTGFVFVSEKKAEELKSYKAIENDLIFTAAGTLGQVGIIPKNSAHPVYIISNKQMRARFNLDIIDPLFAFYWFSSKKMAQYIKRLDTGSTIPLINLSVLRKLPIPVPPLTEQQRISQFLQQICNTIETNIQINKLLEESAQALFKSWFVDFDPVKAKIASLETGGTEEDALHAAMSTISGKSAEELQNFRIESPDDYAELRATAELFPSAMEDEVPVRWAKSEIGKEVKVAGGGTPSTKNTEYWDNGDIHWTTPKDLSSIDERVLTDTSRKITEKGLSKISSDLLPIDTVLLSSRAPVGYLALAKVPVAINQGYIAMQCQQMLPPEYVLQWCHANMDEIKQRSSGTTFAEISKRNFKLIEVIVPSAELLERYAKSTSQLYDFITANVIQNKALEETRDCLLPKLLSGAIQLSGE